MANTAVPRPLTTTANRGVWVLEFTVAKHLNNRPSEAMAYMPRGKANREPSREELKGAWSGVGYVTNMFDKVAVRIGNQ